MSGWKQIPVGPFDLSGDSEPTLSADLNTQGYGVKLSDTLPNQGYSGIIVKGQVDASASIGHLMAFDSNAGDGIYYNADGSINSTTNVAIGLLVEKTDETGTWIGKVLVNGLFKNNTLGVLAKGSPLYLGTVNSNLNSGISVVPPADSDTGSTLQTVGYVWDNSDGNKIIYIKASPMVMRIS